MKSRVILTFLFGLVAAHATAQQSMPRMDLQIGMYRINSEVAADQGNRMQGLMHRKSMAQHEGMLFVFTEQAIHCMWMRNTNIPLSVAFLDESGRIINVEDMEPHTENNHCAKTPARYALEMNKGWFAARKIKAGTTIKGIEKAPAPR